MRKDEAMQLAQRINNNPRGTSDTLDPVIAQVVRILPADVDPVIGGDNGWDVEVTAIRDDDVTNGSRI